MPNADVDSHAALPTIVVLATGGTIAGSGSQGRATNYRPGQIGIEDLVGCVPGIDAVAHVRGMQICNVNSDDITGAHWIALARTIDELAARTDIDGFVVTHGTDTMDETAYFLNLTVKTDKPVVLTGSMRPATATSADGPMNLFQALSLAASPDARGRGVMVAFSDAIFGGRDVRKVSTFQTDAFSENDFGCMGYLIDGQPHFFNGSTKLHTLGTEFDASEIDGLPRVDAVYFTVDADPGAIDYCVKSGARGIIVVGAGSGGYSTPWNDRISAFAGRGIPIVRCSRVGAGLITHDDFYRGDLVRGCDLPPQKAAVLLRLALTKTSDTALIQRMFDVY